MPTTVTDHMLIELHDLSHYMMDTAPPGYGQALHEVLAFWHAMHQHPSLTDDGDFWIKSAVLEVEAADGHRATLTLPNMVAVARLVVANDVPGYRPTDDNFASLPLTGESARLVMDHPASLHRVEEGGPLYTVKFAEENIDDRP